ncbi:MAG TPA: ABC transporter permease [Blastocatellia bacterium]|jgi:putative ABC transport system permease protein|nr:ABC transporter permease [Blastocatellia bacterium]
MQTLIQDLRYGARMLLKNPGFTLIAVMTLGLGIGANTAIFSVVNGVLLRPLAYREPERIVTLLNYGRGPVSPANFLDFRSGSQSFAQMAAAEAWGATLAGADRAEAISGLRMGEGLFALLGEQPLLGRTLQSEDYQPGKDHALVLSHKLWQREFGGDRNIVGRNITLSGESYAVVGVMPPQFQFPPFWSTRAEMWTPLDLRPRATSRGGSSLRVFARLKPGVTLQQAQAEIDVMNTRLAQAYPESNAGLNVRVDPLNEKVVGNVRLALLVLSGAVGFVLLIACANVACLLLARAAARQTEAAVRVALGASRWRIVRQLLTESLLLSVCGAAVGILLAVWGVDWLTTLLAGNSSSFNVRLPRLSEIRIDLMALGFALVVTLATSLLFGLVPALAASKPDLSQSIKESGRGAAGGRRRLRETLVVVELALALVMLIGAGLLINSFLKLQAVDPGFNPRNALTMTVSLSGASQYVGPTRESFYQRLTDRLTALPGVESVSAINHLPLAGDTWTRALTIEGRPLPPPGQGIEVVFRVSRRGYFQTMGIPLRAGRDFTEYDAANSPGVIIINETLARRNWPSEDPIGKRVTLDDPRDNSRAPQWLTVVGVVKDVKQDSWTDAPSNEIYLPFQQSRDFYAGTARHFTTMTIVVRTSVEPQSLGATAQEAVRSLDRNLPVSSVATMEQVITDTLWQPRFNLQLIGIFAALAMTLAAIGLYGVMSYSVAQRTREVGLRMALGAGRRDVLKLVVGQGMKLALAGVALGLLASVALTRLMEKLLFEVSATDFSTFAVIAVLLMFVALVACWIPARRATKVDPMVALRCE